MHFVVTGGRGYLGRAVVSRALCDGHTVTLLGTHASPDAKVRSLRWRLGEPVPPAAWSEPADAVIHLAHAWHDSAPEPGDVNLVGTQMLVEAAHAARVKRFVFASSLSARADARNRYGRVKYRIENLLDRPDEVSARIGLMYGGAALSLWGLLRRLVAKLPLLLVVGRRQVVQPIHVSDVADGLLRLATKANIRQRVVLATDPPVEFGQFLQETAWRLYRRRLILLDLPQRPLLATLNGLIYVDLPLNGLRERVLGLVGLSVQPAQADAEWLGLQPMTLQQGLDSEVPRRRARETVEAAALLNYVLGARPHSATLHRFLRGWRRLDFGAPLLPNLALRCPHLLRVFEPLPGDTRPRAMALRARLVAAAFIADTEPGRSGKLYAYVPAGRALAWTRLLMTGVMESLLLLPRAIVSRWMWQ